MYKVSVLRIVLSCYNCKFGLIRSSIQYCKHSTEISLFADGKVTGWAVYISRLYRSMCLSLRRVLHFRN